MKPRFFLILSLLTVILLVSCAPAKSPAPVQPETQDQPAPMAEAPQATPTAEMEAAPVEPEMTEAPADAPDEVPLPVPTSRGPDLEATDPVSVSLTSGDLQLVEFFRFT